MKLEVEIRFTECAFCHKEIEACQCEESKKFIMKLNNYKIICKEEITKEKIKKLAEELTPENVYNINALISLFSAMFAKKINTDDINLKAFLEKKQQDCAYILAYNCRFFDASKIDSAIESYNLSSCSIDNSDFMHCLRCQYKNNISHFAQVEYVAQLYNFVL